MLPKKRCRAGVTLIEIVALLGILLFLFACLAPFVHQLRERASRGQGLNNLKNIALGVIHCADVHRTRLPPIAGIGGDGVHGSVLFHILPFMEQMALHGRGDVWSAGTIGTPLAVYLDPRDKSAPPGNKFENWLATTNYAGNWMVFKTGENRFPASIPDGTSLTFMFAERYQVCSGTPCGWGYDRVYYWAPMFGRYSTGKFQTTPGAADCDPGLPQSLDDGGILVVACDGAAHTISDRISPQLWNLLVDPADGQPARIPD
jgi:hypothetical protein